MIEYSPLWETLKQKKITTYTLRYKFHMSSATIQRLKKNQSVSTNTINDLCIILSCNITDIMEFKEDEREKSYMFSDIK